MTQVSLAEVPVEELTLAVFRDALIGTESFLGDGDLALRVIKSSPIVEEGGEGVGLDIIANSNGDSGSRLRIRATTPGFTIDAGFNPDSEETVSPGGRINVSVSAAPVECRDGLIVGDNAVPVDDFVRTSSN